METNPATAVAVLLSCLRVAVLLSCLRVALPRSSLQDHRYPSILWLAWCDTYLLRATQASVEIHQGHQSHQTVVPTATPGLGSTRCGAHIAPQPLGALHWSLQFHRFSASVKYLP